VGHEPELDTELREMAAIVAGHQPALTDDPARYRTRLLAMPMSSRNCLRVRPGDNPTLGWGWLSAPPSNGLRAYLRAATLLSAPPGERPRLRELGPRHRAAARAAACGACSNAMPAVPSTHNTGVADGDGHAWYGQVPAWRARWIDNLARGGAARPVASWRATRRGHPNAVMAGHRALCRDGYHELG
jgi:hypothetical protein